MLPNLTALLPNNMAKATMQRAKNIHLTPSNTPRMLDSPASKPTTRANSKSKALGPTKVGPSFPSTQSLISHQNPLPMLQRRIIARFAIIVLAAHTAHALQHYGNARQEGLFATNSVTKPYEF
jgi:hypothetical protein